jgi:hypothetical protein
MYEIEIKFRIEDKNEIIDVLQQIEVQIQQGEFNNKYNPNGYCANKYSPIDRGVFQDKEGYSIGDFRVFDLGDKKIKDIY